MSTEQDRARAVINQFLQQMGKSRDPLTNDIGLYGDGLELDSLEAAELSALLEDELGSDPFSAGETMPETVGDLLGFYEVSSGV